MIPDLNIKDYNYELPDERIAKYPLNHRDESKLLLYDKGNVSESIFKNLPDYIPEGSLMIFNDTKVVPARMHFRRETGAHIEIFCLEPVEPCEYATIFASTQDCVWKCVIGNAKRWKDDVLRMYNPDGDSAIAAMDLRATLICRDGETGHVRFEWSDGAPFSAVLDKCGRVPIPPYLNRETEDIDLERYQTVYSRVRGSVAAPTAGLHFTDEVLSALREKGVRERNVCLHVGAGTFFPVKSEHVAEHPMHREPFVVSRSLLEEIRNNDKPLTAVGTTSVRTLESLYYAGVSCIETGAPKDVQQWAPYEREYSYSTSEALDAIIEYLDKESLEALQLSTRIIIVPGFRFRLVDNLVTNFHQPESTLILLVSAFVGGDWRTIYDYALGHGFRFLSYGDSSFLKRI